MTSKFAKKTNGVFRKILLFFKKTIDELNNRLNITEGSTCERKAETNVKHGEVKLLEDRWMLNTYSIGLHYL